ncbi:unnamed protein product (macronuclear) [Paramecium tetraurelia]|uniref:Transmembrane protein n=1 Tax=Paramecium tetraurelia TaxID=5888 RepID=A0E8G6_PARTE|nr:uncharacterized protein GSPATT00024312001 [Paramecium tetraurelia]CAK91583.1 unnamed protein product [Paramecium tetraurelia]|eukprot:XP_001458980.1 hypothetical protein (macronuclear) [Paramecium tetraurelia strain d4-2]
MQNPKAQEIKQQSCFDYIFDSWIQVKEQPKIKYSQQTQLTVLSQRQKKFKCTNKLNQNNDYIIKVKSQIDKKEQDVSLNSFRIHLDEFKQKEEQSFLKQPIIKPKYRSHSVSKNYNEDYQVKHVSVANCSTMISSNAKSSLQNSLNFSQNCKLIFPKIKQQYSPKMRIKQFRILCKVIGKLVVLFLKNLAKTSLQRIGNIQKLQYVLNLKKIFKFDRKIKESLSKSFREWVDPSLKKIQYYLQNTLVQKNDDNLLDLQKQKDQEQILNLNFAKFLFQNLELITRKGKIPKEIVSAMSKSLYKENNQYVSSFVAQRTKFLKKSFSILEAQLICCEYILFNAVIIQLFELANNLKYQSFNHNLKCKIQILMLTTIINQFYIEAFKNMPIINFDIKKEQLYTRMLYVTTDQEQHLKLVDTKEVNHSETLILGLQHQEYIKGLFQQKEKQKQKLQLIFNKFIHNLSSQIDISE